MPVVKPSARIDGVVQVELAAFEDSRGRFLETFRREWFPGREWTEVQANRSDSRKGVLRGLHYHLRQVDFWIPAAGRFRVGLYDLRVGSPTRGRAELLEMDAANPAGLYVPVGVAHGFLALTDATLNYVVDAYYDGTDELGVAWNDPDIGIDWGVDAPVLSPRDLANPRLRELPADALPSWDGTP